MVNERLAADVATMLEGLQDQMRGIADLQQRRSELTATASIGDDRVQVTVNADGMVVETKFGSEVSDLSYEELAEYVTAAAQAAMQGAQNRSRELMRPLIERRSRLPKLSEIVEGAPDLEDILPPAPPPSTEPPHLRGAVEQDDRQQPLIADTDH